MIDADKLLAHITLKDWSEYLKYIATENRKIKAANKAARLKVKQANSKPLEINPLTGRVYLSSFIMFIAESEKEPKIEEFLTWKLQQLTNSKNL